MIASNIKDFFSTLNRSMRTLVRNLYSKTSPDTTTSKWRRRFLSILRMALLGIIGFVISILWLLLQSLRVGSCLYAGLKKVSTFILTSSWKRRTWTTLLHQIPIRCTSLLTHWLIKCLERERQLSLLSPSWTVLQKRSLNRLLADLIKLSLRL